MGIISKSHISGWGEERKGPFSEVLSSLLLPVPVGKTPYVPSLYRLRAYQILPSVPSLTVDNPSSKVTFGIGGLVTGLLVGNKEFVEFFCELPDDRAFMGRVQKNGYMDLIKLRLGGKRPEEQDSLSKFRQNRETVGEDIE